MSSLNKSDNTADVPATGSDLTKTPPAIPTPKGSLPAGARWFPWLMVIFSVLYVGSKLRPQSYETRMDVETFKKLPVSDRGRVKPVDTVARNALLAISGRRTVYHTVVTGKEADGRPITKTTAIPASQWYLDVLSSNNAHDYEIFRIDHPDVLSIFGLTQEDPIKGGVKKRFSFNTFLPHGKALDEQIRQAMETPGDARTLYQDKVLELSRKLKVYTDIIRKVTPHAVPPKTSKDEWTSLDEQVQLRRSGLEPSDDAKTLSSIYLAYGEGKTEEFNRLVKQYSDSLATRLAPDVRRARFEVMFNNFAPFYVCSALYVLAFLLAVFSWLGRGGLAGTGIEDGKVGFWGGALSGPSLGRAAFLVLCFTAIVHSFGLIARMYIEKRPPVTNLYSSAVFIGWVTLIVALLIGLAFAKRQTRAALLIRNAVNVVAAALGFITLVVAHNLASDGSDTMEVMRAVLDTNFWLATHVVTVTMGYAATFIAGAVAIQYLVLGLLTREMDKDSSRVMGNVIYGTVCFATLMSFVGTVLGGIWADQSWGRFWGWDPKENGALIIVIWNALILHARWGGLVKARGIATLAIFGNVVTAWSWFGVNQLGIGLHSYGFTDSATFWTGAFVLSQLHIMSAAVLPHSLWRSNEPVSVDSVRPVTLRIFAYLNPIYAMTVTIGLLAVLPSMTAQPGFKGYLLVAALLAAVLFHIASIGLLRAAWAKGFVVGNVAAVFALSNVLFLLFGGGEDRYLAGFFNQLASATLIWKAVAYATFIVLVGYPVALILAMNLKYSSFSSGGGRYREARDQAAVPVARKAAPAG